jgi:hypothetical protein
MSSLRVEVMGIILRIPSPMPIRHINPVDMEETTSELTIYTGFSESWPYVHRRRFVPVTEAEETR